MLMNTIQNEVLMMIIINKALIKLLVTKRQLFPNGSEVVYTSFFLNYSIHPRFAIQLQETLNVVNGK